MSAIYEKPIEIRFKDLDAMKHVNNAVMFTYFEEARKGFFLDLVHATTPGEFQFILAHIECDYLKPVHLQDRLLMKMWVGDIGKKSFTFHYRLVDERDPSIIFSTGKSVQVCYDYRAKRTVEVSTELREILNRFQASDRSE